MKRFGMKTVMSIYDFASSFVLQNRTKAKLCFPWICSLEQQHDCWKRNRLWVMTLFSALEEWKCDSFVLAAIEVVPTKTFGTFQVSHPAGSSAVSRSWIPAALSTLPSSCCTMLFLALLYQCEAVAFLVRLTPTRCLAIWKYRCSWRLGFLRSVLGVGDGSSSKRQRVAVLEQWGPKNKKNMIAHVSLTRG